MSPTPVAALCLCSFMAGVASMLVGSYVWLDRAWRR